MLKEFKEFAMKGNVLDMAIGVIMGGAFGKIVSSLADAYNGWMQFSQTASTVSRL